MRGAMDCFARKDDLRVRFSKRLAEEVRAFQPVSPGEFNRLGNSNPHARDNLWLARAGMQRDRGSVERQAVVPVGNPERLRQLARTRAQRSLIVQSPPA